MAIHNIRKRNILKKIYEKFKIYKIKIIVETFQRLINENKNLKIFYRYQNSQAFLHPLFTRNYEKPPIGFTIKAKAKLFHWWHSCDDDVGYNKNFIIEPIDHFFSVKRVWEPIEGISSLEECKKIYLSEFCKKIIVSSQGQRDIFIHYCSELESKMELIYPSCVPKISKNKSIMVNKKIKYLCIVSDFYKKGLDIVIDSWLKTRISNSCLTIVCTDVPNEYMNKIKNNNSIVLLEIAPIPEDIKRDLYKTHDVAIIPVHTDGLTVYVEAVEYALPIITMRSQHSKTFVEEDNGYEVDVPFYFYDVDGYGLKWKTWEDFFQLLEDAKIDGKFDKTIVYMSQIFEKLENNKNILLNLKENAFKVLFNKFKYTHRNKKLNGIYKKVYK